MSAITEIYNRAHVLELVAILANVPFKKSETERNYY